jgi:hypothetical protein
MTVTEVPAEILERVNAAFDAARARLGVQYDSELSRHWPVSTKTIWEWRTGQWTKGDTILIGVLLGMPEAIPTRDRTAA